MSRLAVINSAESVKEIRKIIAEARPLVSLFKDITKEVNTFNRSLRSARPREYTEAIQNLTNANRQLSAIQRQISGDMERLSRIERNNAQAAAENARARREAAAATREESRLRQQLAREQRQNTNNSNQENSAYQRLKREVREATARSRDYGAEIVNLNRRRREGNISANDYRRQMAQLSKDFKTSTAEALRLQKQLDKLNKATSAHAQKNGALDGRVTDILKAFGITATIDNIASSFYKFGEKAVETARKLDTLRLSQKAVFKTSEEVNLQNEFLTKTANRYGIEILGLSEAYTKFAAAAQGTYLEGKRTQDIFDSVTRSSALLGVSSDETNGILRALGQMMSKGKVQAEELRGQLGDRMAGAFKLFADGMGVSTAQLDAMLKKGEVLADDVLPKFAEQLNKKYTLGVGDQIETQAAAIARAGNAWVAFVDGVESGSGVISKSVIGFTGALTSMLEALTPSKEVTFIEKEQAQLNMLGIELRKNWNDEKKRKEILDEIIKLNPFIKQGLDDEHLTLAKVTEELQKVNEQYIYKIALQKQEEKIKELVEDQAQAYIYLNKVYSDNAKEYNSMNEATKKTLDAFRDGSLGYGEALRRINKSTKSFTKENDVATDMLNRMNSIIAQSSLNFDGFNRGIDGNRLAIKNATADYDSLKNMFAGIVNQQQQLIYMNGLTAKSFNSMGKEQQDTWKRFAEDAQKATLEGKNFFLFNNQWRAKNKTGGWFSTGKKSEDWYLEDNKLLKRQKTTLLPKDPEKPKAARLTAAQKDQMNIFQAERDTALAYLTQRQNEGLINEQQFQEKRIQIIKGYAAKVSAYLKGNNAKEKQVEGSVILRASTEIKSALKEQFDYFAKQSEETYKKTVNSYERQSKELEKNDFLTDSERIEEQIKLDNQALKEAEKFYKDQIDLANSFHQDTLELERKRDEEIGKIQDSRTDKMRSKLNALQQDLERQTATATAGSNKDFEEQKSLILADKKLSSDEKAYRISLLEIDKQIVQNRLKIEELKSLKAEYDLKVAMAGLSGKENPEAKKTAAELAEQIVTLENANTELNKQAKDTVSEKTQAIRDTLAQGFADLGFEGFADAYSATMIRLKNDTASWKDYAVLAASAVLDAMTDLNNQQKERTIASLDEQLKHSQETTEQEIGFINERLGYLNGLDELSKEQMSERNRLEDEARTYKEQQQQREKMIETQKAKAEQKAAAQQALINGALAATMTLAQMGFVPGAIPAALALAFGIAQSIAISSKNPIPQYWVGTMNAKPGIAWRDEKGAEIHTDKNDNIKSLGDNSGAKLVHMEAGDKVYTAGQSKSILKNLKTLPKLGDKLFQNVALNSLKAPSMNMVINNNQPPDNSSKIAEEVGRQFDRFLSKYSNPYTVRKKGKIIEYNGSKNPVIIGTYDIEKAGEDYGSTD